MFNIPYIATQLFPDKTIDQLRPFVDACVESLDEYYSGTWNVESVFELENEKVQVRLVKTLYESQFAYSGVVDDIMRSFEDWTNGVVVFDMLDPKINEFAQRYYCFIGWLHFDSVSMSRQSFLLGSRFLILAAVWDIPLYPSVQRHFARYMWLEPMKEDAQFMALSMEKNQTMFGTEKRIIKTIAEWIKDFNEFFHAKPSEKPMAYMENSMEVQRLDEEARNMLERILTLYYGLKMGDIWRSVDDQIAGGYPRKEINEEKSRDEYYVQILYEGGNAAVTEWLKDHEDIAEWLVLNQKDESYVMSLFKVLFKHLDLNNPEQVELLVAFINDLKENGLESVDEIVYFDEKNGVFTWNKEFFVAEEPRQNVPTTPPASVQSPKPPGR